MILIAIINGYPNNNKEIRAMEIKKKMLKLNIECAFDTNYGIFRNAFFRVERLLGLHKKTDKLISKLEKTLSKFDIYDSEIWCNHGNWQGKLEYSPRNHYGQGKMVKFEDLNDWYLIYRSGDGGEDPNAPELPAKVVFSDQDNQLTEVIDTYRPYRWKKITQ
jgi:hypothetical protein